MKVKDREWCWIAVIAAVIALGIQPTAWIGIVAIMLVWALLSDDGHE